MRNRQSLVAPCVSGIQMNLLPGCRTAGNVAPVHVIILHLCREVGVSVGITFMQLETGLLNYWDQTEVPSCCSCIIKWKWGLFTARLNIYPQYNFRHRNKTHCPLINFCFCEKMSYYFVLLFSTNFFDRKSRRILLILFCFFSVTEKKDEEEDEDVFRMCWGLEYLYLTSHRDDLLWVSVHPWLGVSSAASG